MTEKIEKASLKIIESESNCSDAFLNSKNNNLSVFKCQFENCCYMSSDKKVFKEHKFSHENNLSLISKIKIIYAKKASDIRTQNLFIENSYKKANQSSILDSVKELSNGFALKKIERGRFTDNQKTYLLEKFNIGERTNRKVDPKADTVCMYVCTVL